MADANPAPATAPDIWGGGHLLAFSGVDGPTDFFDGLTLRTAFDATAIDVKLPGAARLHFADAPPLTAIVGGDHFDLALPAGRVRGALLDAYHLLIEGPCTPRDVDPALAIRQAGPRTLVGSAGHFDPGLLDADLDAAIAARRQWVARSRVLRRTPAAHRRPMVKALSQMKTMVYGPQQLLRRRFTTPDRWPHRGMWLWDSAFHAIGLRHVDIALAREILAAVFDGQQPDGRVPIRHDPDRHHSGFTQPPTLALAVHTLEQTASDPAWLADLFPRLAAYLEWDLAHRDGGNGLPVWAIEGDPNCRSGESGMDNSPRFDAATRLEATDFSALLALECELMAGFARTLGRPAEVRRWSERHRRLCDLIEARLWRDQPGFYTDFDLDAGAPSPVLASAGFLPLVCGAASRARAETLVRHLHDPQMFATPLAVASIAACDTAHYRKDMWRGPVWVNLNWLIAAGLERYGFSAEAADLRARTVAEIERFHARFGTFFEFFDDRQEVDPPRLLRKGRCAPEVSFYHQAFFDYGWTATLYVDLVLADEPPLLAV